MATSSRDDHDNHNHLSTTHSSDSLASFSSSCDGKNMSRSSHGPTLTTTGGNDAKEEHIDDVMKYISTLDSETIRWLNRRRPQQAKVLPSRIMPSIALQLKTLFNYLDQDNSGSIDIDELKEAIHYVTDKLKPVTAHQPQPPQPSSSSSIDQKAVDQAAQTHHQHQQQQHQKEDMELIKNFFLEMDKDHSGTVDFMEFLVAVTTSGDAPKPPTAGQHGSMGYTKQQQEGFAGHRPHNADEILSNKAQRLKTAFLEFVNHFRRQKVEESLTSRSLSEMEKYKQLKILFHTNYFLLDDHNSHNHDGHEAKTMTTSADLTALFAHQKKEMDTLVHTNSRRRKELSRAKDAAQLSQDQRDIYNLHHPLSSTASSSTTIAIDQSRHVSENDTFDVDSLFDNRTLTSSASYSRQSSSNNNHHNNSKQNSGNNMIIQSLSGSVSPSYPYASTLANDNDIANNNHHHHNNHTSNLLGLDIGIDTGSIGVTNTAHIHHMTHASSATAAVVRPFSASTYYSHHNYNNSNSLSHHHHPSPLSHNNKKHIGELIDDLGNELDELNIQRKALPSLSHPRGYHHSPHNHPQHPSSAHTTPAHHHSQHQQQQSLLHHSYSSPASTSSNLLLSPRNNAGNVITTSGMMSPTTSSSSTAASTPTPTGTPSPTAAATGLLQSSPTQRHSLHKQALLGFANNSNNNSIASGGSTSIIMLNNSNYNRPMSASAALFSK